MARRRFVLTAIAASTVIAVPRSWLPGNIAWADSPENPAFVRLARLLFPHAGLSQAVYAEVAGSVFTSFAADTESGNLLDMAETALDAQTSGEWIDADEDSQISAIRSIEQEAFFAQILTGLRAAFYYHPKVWSHIERCTHMTTTL
jgi:hypothetical protein